MNPLEVLAEAVIDTLKEFSIGKLTLTSETLQEAFLAREEITSLLIGSPTYNGRQALSAPGEDKSDVAPTKSDTPNELSDELLMEFREVFLKIFDSLGPIIKGQYESLFSELMKQINESESLLNLGALGKHMGQMVDALVSQAIDQIDFSNDFFVELIRDLYKMEGQLYSYQSYSRETNQISNAFHDNLLSQTGDVQREFDLGKNLQDIRHLIAIKLNTISQAIETKRRADEVRLREADSKINDLQNNRKTYKQEIMQVKGRSESLEKKYY